MTDPVVELFSTSILSNVKVRTRHERYTSVLAIKKVPYVYHDLASDDDAKSRWRRKAKDPQLPGILVNNEWVGSYDEFEEAVEFGELELFLGVTPAAAQTLPSAPHPAQSAVSSKDPSLYPTLPYAAEGAGRWKEPDADQFISSLNIKEDELNDADVDAMLADIGKLPPAPVTVPEKKYVPSKEAAIKPLRFAKMGPTTSHQRMPSGSPSPSSASAGTRASPIARYSATQRSTKALAAEAEALSSNRKTSGALLRDAVSQGKTLDDAMEQSRMKHIVGQDNIDDLFASLGLTNVDIGDDEVDQFLEQGAIPQGLRMGGDRVHRSSSIADKARDKAVARDLALKAKEKGHGSARSSLSNDVSKSFRLQPASSIATALDASSTDTATLADHASGPSSEAATVAADSSKASNVKEADEAEAQDAKEVGPTIAETTKSSDGPEHVAAEPADAEETKTAAAELGGDVGGETVAEEMEPELASSHSIKDAAAADQVADPEEVKADVAELSSVPSDSTVPQEETHPSEKEATQELANEAPTIAASDASSTEQQVPEKTETVAEGVSDAPSTHAEDKSESAVNQVDEEGKIKIESSSSTELAGSSSMPALEKLIAATEDEAVTKEESVEACAAVDQTHIDGERTPTNDVAADPIEAELSQAPPVAAAPAVPAIAAIEEPAAEDDHDDFELELAQAALIASRYETRKAGTPTPPRPGARIDSMQKGLDAISPAKSTLDAPVSPSRSPLGGEAERAGSASPLGLGSGGASGLSPRPSAARQASSSSSSSRKAIDVSRPIIPSVSPPTSANAEQPTSPDTSTKKKKGIRGFGLGWDKDKDKDKDKENASDKKTTNSKAGAGASRHERTISQILREADAVLQSDDYEGESTHEGEGEDTEDSAMFGSASVDVEGGPIASFRSSSRPN